MAPETGPTSDRAAFRSAFAVSFLALGVLLPALWFFPTGAPLWFALAYPVVFGLACLAALVRPSNPVARGTLLGALAATGFALAAFVLLILLGPCGVGLLK